MGFAEGVITTGVNIIFKEKSKKWRPSTHGKYEGFKGDIVNQALGETFTKPNWLYWHWHCTVQ